VGNLADGIISGLFKGLILAFWICGSILIILSVLRILYQWMKKKQRHQSLEFEKSEKLKIQVRNFRFLKKFIHQMDVAELKISLEAAAIWTIGLGIGSFFAIQGSVYWLKETYASGDDRTSSVNIWFVSLCISMLIASGPYFFVRFRLQRKLHRIALRMISLVQNLIGHYREGISVTEILKNSLPTMPNEVATEWSRLILSLHLKPVDEALLEFASRLDNEWAEDLVDLMLSASTGVDITKGLHKLVQTMQTSKKNEEDRLAMVSIFRIGVSIMSFGAIGIIGVNTYLDGANYHHYFVSSGGKGLLLFSVFVFFGSMIAVVRSGKKQF
jgi:Flp pilus assembly protein TadB